MDKKKATINPINKTIIILPIHSKSCVESWKNKKPFQRITKIKPFINKYNWKGISFPSEKDTWKKFEKNNLTIALNVLYAKKKKYILFIFQNIAEIVKRKLFF